MVTVSTRNILKYSPLIFLLFAIFLFFANCSTCTPAGILIPKYPLPTYEDKGLLQRTAVILPPNVIYRVIESGSILLDLNSFKYIDGGRIVVPASNTRRYVNISLVEYEGQRMWCSENLIAVKDKKSKDVVLAPVFERNDRFLPFLFVGFALLFYIAYKVIYVSSLVYICLFYFVLRICAYALFLFYNGYFIIDNPDSQQFFTIAREILEFHRHSVVTNQVGTALLFVPFIAALKANCYLDMADVFTIFNFLFIGSGISLLAILAVYKMAKSKVSAIHLTGLMTSLFPAAAWIYYDHALSLKKIYLGNVFLRFDPPHPFSVVVYNKALLSSWNGLSDNIALFYTMLAIVILLYLRPSFARYSLMGLAIGISLATRYGSIVIMPAIMILDLYDITKERIYPLKMLYYYTLLAIFCFIGFSPQMLDNYLITGYPLQPVAEQHLYVGGTNLWNMFSIGNLFEGYNYYMLINYNIFIICLFSLYTIKEYKYGIFLWLWIFVTLTFYSLSNFYNCTPVRYIIGVYTAIYIALGLSMKNGYHPHTTLLYILLYVLNINLDVSLFVAKYLPPGISDILIHLSSIIFAFVPSLINREKYPWQGAVCFAAIMLILIINDWRLIMFGLFLLPIFYSIKIILKSDVCRNISLWQGLCWREKRMFDR